MTNTRGATLQFGGSPWAREAMWTDRERSAALGHRATELGVSVSVVGKTEAGPWVVRVHRGARALRFAGSGIHDTISFGLERWAAGADDSGVRWTAGADRLAHAHSKLRSLWTLCKAPAVDERFRHPELRRCQACWLALDRRTVAA